LKGDLAAALRVYGGQGAAHRILAVDHTKVVRAIGEFQNRRGSFGNNSFLKAERLWVPMD
jgi:hypothetical protein